MRPTVENERERIPDVESALSRAALARWQQRGGGLTSDASGVFTKAHGCRASRLLPATKDFVFAGMCEGFGALLFSGSFGGESVAARVGAGLMRPAS